MLLDTWLITGCSSGLGRHLALRVLERGFAAVVTARRPEALDDIVAAYPSTACAAALDVRDPQQIAATIELARTRFGGVDVLVNNAGYGLRSAVEEADPAQVMDLFATNFFGPMALVQAVLPGMRARRSGTIVNVSSIGGRRANPGSGYYAASKFALEGLSDALRKEVGPLGINVIVVEPGGFTTNFFGTSLQRSHLPIADYADTAGRRRTDHGGQLGDPARAARIIVETVGASAPPFRLLLGSDAVAIVKAELEGQLAELNEWAAVSATSDHR